MVLEGPVVLALAKGVLPELNYEVSYISQDLVYR